MQISFVQIDKNEKGDTYLVKHEDFSHLQV